MAGTPRWLAGAQIVFGVDAFGACIVAQAGASYVDVERQTAIPPPVAEETLQRVAECLAELAVEVSVYEWVERGVEVADPEEYCDHNVRRGQVTQTGDGVPKEEWQPADDECAHNYAQSSGSLVFSFHFD